MEAWLTTASASVDHMENRSDAYPLGDNRTDLQEPTGVDPYKTGSAQLQFSG
jgi:hypothetical protein